MAAATRQVLIRDTRTGRDLAMTKADKLEALDRWGKVLPQPRRSLIERIALFSSAAIAVSKHRASRSSLRSAIDHAPVHGARGDGSGTDRPPRPSPWHRSSACRSIGVGAVVDDGVRAGEAAPAHRARGERRKSPTRVG